MSKPIPAMRSPFAACTQGAEPECVYTAMFSCSASMNFQPSASPITCSQAAIVRYPVPDDAGCGITTLPLKPGPVRSFQDTGAFTFALPPSTVLKQTTERYASMPVQV